MHGFSNIVKKILGWVLAAFIAFIICNLACFAVYDPCQELTREHGSTTGFLLPDSFGVYGLEGYCIADIDHEGYVNRDAEVPHIPKDSLFRLTGATVMC